MNKVKAIIFALLAAVFYAINVSVSKVLLSNVGPATMAALLYLGAGIGIALLSLVHRKDANKTERLTKTDLPYVVGMIVLDIAAPIFLMLGISYGSSANASLLGNFEIAATIVIALFIFKEAVTKASFCVYDEGYRKDGDWALNIRSVIVFGHIEFVEDRKKIYQISAELSRKFTTDEDYIKREIERSGPGTLMFALVPEHITGKLVNEA